MGKLFDNPVMPVCNLTSQSVSYLRLMQFAKYLTDVVNCFCEPNLDHICIKRPIHLRNQDQFFMNKQLIEKQL